MVYVQETQEPGGLAAHSDLSCSNAETTHVNTTGTEVLSIETVDILADLHG